MSTIDTGDTAWVAASTALVLLMTPGLAFFYGGMSRSKNVLNTLMMSYICMAVITVLWFCVGYSLAFGPDGWFIGNLSYYFLDGVGGEPNPVYSSTIPELLFCAFQLMFAIITPALISGAMVERTKFTSYLIFIVCWALIVYSPVAHWVWAAWEEPDGTMDYGWLRKRGALDFAGGTVVHIISGVSGLVASVFIGPRKGFPSEPIRAHNIPFTILGVGLLWFGWFGFNGGSALGANSLAAYAIFNTHLAAASASLTWVMIEFAVSKPSLAGAGTGAVVGLVVITPGCGFVKPFAAVIFGMIGTMICFAAIWGKHYMIKRARRAERDNKGSTKHWSYCISWIDDSLDAFGCHGLGGCVGAILTGFFSTTQVNELGIDGVFYGNWKLLWNQLLAIVATAGWAGIVTAAVLFVLKKTIGLRADEASEEMGMDESQHGEEGYLGLFKITGDELWATMSMMGSVEPSLEDSDTEHRKVQSGPNIIQASMRNLVKKLDEQAKNENQVQMEEIQIQPEGDQPHQA